MTCNRVVERVVKIDADNARVFFADGNRVGANRVVDRWCAVWLAGTWFGPTVVDTETLHRTRWGATARALKERLG